MFLIPRCFRRAGELHLILQLRLNITIVQGAFFPVPAVHGGAVEKIWYELGREFARRGHGVTHISKHISTLEREEKQGGVRYLRLRGYHQPVFLPYLKILDLLYSRRVKKCLPCADVLVSNTFALPLLLRKSNACTGALYVHVQRYPRGQMGFYEHAARIQAVSSHIEEAILQEAPGLAGKTRVITNPIGKIFLETPLPARTLGSSRPLRVLYVGRLHPEKGVHLLIEAFTRLRFSSGQSAELRVVGPHRRARGGGGEKYLQHLKQLSAVRNDIRFIGPEYDAGKLCHEYDLADLFVYPSLAVKGEALPVSPLEAMARGCPTVVSNLACFRDYLKPDGNGFIFDHEADPVGSLTTMLSVLLADPNRRMAAGHAARGTALDHHSVETVAEAYLHDFSTLAFGNSLHERLSSKVAVS